MSLLIKALDKAQAEKAQTKDSAGVDKKAPNQPSKETKPKVKKSPKPSVKKPSDDALTLSPPEENIAVEKEKKRQQDAMPAALKGTAAELVQKEAQQQNKQEPEMTLESSPAPAGQAQAANVFAAKHAESSNQTAKIAMIVGLLALMLLAAFAYWYQFVFNAPAIVIPSRPALSQSTPAPLPDSSVPEEMVASVHPDNETSDLAAAADLPAQPEPEMNKAPQEEMVAETQEVFMQKAEQSAPSVAVNDVKTDVAETLTHNETVVTNSSEESIHLTHSPLNDGIASESASIQITQAKTESGVNPILMRAYEAYNAGDDNQAQADYKQVLKRYGANVDAMLGLGAIATRQGRLADANGWYRKVLEQEPRNEVAKAGLLSIQQETQPQNNESHIKSMLASAPDDANLHAALGDVYAANNHWAAAQQAYFDAYRLNMSAENAMNLGVSLDQMGKASLALPYYQEALKKADQSSVIDRAALEARISSIQ